MTQGRAAGIAAGLILLLLSGSGQARGLELSGSWGGNGDAAGQFSGPAAVAVDADGNVYVVDTGNRRIQRFTDSGSFVGQWGTAGSGDGEFNAPAGIAIDDDGNVFVADTGNHRIQKFSSSGDFMSSWGAFGSAAGQFDMPMGLALDESGNLLVVDAGNARIQRFDSSGQYVSQWGAFGSASGEFTLPTDVAAGGGQIYVADAGANRVQRFDGNGTFVGSWGELGATDGTFLEPTGIDVAGGFVYVVDRGNYRLQKFTANGEFVASAGHAAVLYDPTGLAVTPDGVVYLTDTGSDRVQILIPERLHISYTSFPISGIDIGGTFDVTTSGEAFLAQQGAVTATAPAEWPDGIQLYRFKRWTLNGAPQAIGKQTLNLFTSTNLELVAEYELDVVDTDADGLPDWWELREFGDVTSQTGDDDADGDGASNLTEYLSGTDPNDGATILYVKSDAAPGGLGGSWTDAFERIADALAAANAGDQIRVAAGVYDEIIVMVSGVSMYGGFDTTEQLFSDRDLAANPTIIDAAAAGRAAGAHALVLDGTVNARIDGFVLTGGSAGEGAGIYLMDVDATNRLVNLRITGNVATVQGGGIYGIGAAPVLANCLIDGNQSDVGGGVYWDDSSAATMINCTIAGNLAVGAGRALYLAPLSAAALRNCIVWENGGSDEVFVADGASLSVSYSNLDADGFAGVDGNIRQQPFFAGSGARDYRLVRGSPCLDTGSAALVPPFAVTDVAGLLRLQGAQVDMGAYEGEADGDWQLVLMSGWNTLSLPLDAAPESRAQDLLVDGGGLPLTSGQVWRWDTNRVDFAAITGALVGKGGFWAFSPAGGTTATIRGTLVSPDIWLAGGWNLVGPTRTVSLLAATGLEQVAGQIWWWSPTSSRYVAVPGQGQLEPGRGYWIFCRDPQGVWLRFE